MNGAQGVEARHSRWAWLCGLVVALLCLVSSAGPAVAETVVTSAFASTPIPSSPQVFPALVPEGEPESILGVKWDNGVPKFENAPVGHSWARDVAWSPHGHELVTWSGSGQFRVWDAVAGRELRRLHEQSGRPYAVDWSPDGRSFASESADKTIRVWDATTGEELQRFEEHSERVSSIRWSPDGKALASGSDDGTIRVRDATTGKELRRIEGRASGVKLIVWSPDGKCLASSGRDDTIIRIWGIASGTELRQLKGHVGEVYSFAWSPDGKSLASVSRDDTVRVWDAATGMELRRAGAVAFHAVVWSPDGRFLASEHGDNAVRIWDAASGKELRRIGGCSNWGSSDGSAAWSPDGKSLVSAGALGAVCVWDAASGKELRRIEGSSSAIGSVAWSPDCRLLAAVGFVDQTLRLWNVDSGREPWRLEGHSITKVAWSPQGTSLASVSNDNTVRIWDVESGNELRRLEGHSLDVAWSPNGKFLASASTDNSIRLWDAAHGKELRRFEGHSLGPIAWSPQGTTIASACNDNTVRTWDAASGKELLRLEGHSSSAQSIAWSPNGESLVSASQDRTIRIWDAATGKEARRIESSASSSVAWSPDAKYLASPGQGLTAQIWEVATGKKMSRLDGHSNTVLSVAWCPKRNSLASAGFDGAIQVWSFQGSIGTTAALAAVHWASGDGWSSWLANAPAEHRVVRGENGALLRKVGVNNTLESVTPQSGLHPQLTAQASVATRAGQGELGEVTVTVTNASAATEAIWVELRAPVGAAKTPIANTVLRLPPTALRLEPGETTTLSVGYIRHLTDNPAPGLVKALFELHHAHDGGKAIAVPVELRFRSPNVAAITGTPTRNGQELTVPVTLSNVGDQITGRNLAVVAKFVLPDGRAIASDSKTVFDEGVAPGVTKQFSLKVPKEVEKASKFRVELTATEGIAAGIPADSKEIGFVATWTSTSDWLRPRALWLTYVAIALGAAVLLAGIYYLRVYRDPIVVQTAKAPPSLLQQPLRSLPRASRVLARARRLDGTLATLGLSDGQWNRALAVASSPPTTVRHLTELLGARSVTQIDEHTARVELPPLRLRFGPHVAIAVLEGSRIESGLAQRLVETIRESGVTSALLLDLTEIENAREVFAEIARFAPVVLGSAAIRDLLLARHPLRALEGEISKQRPLRELSPYRTAGGVEDATMFFGRGEELRHLADRDLQNAVLVGARQMGKSSLLKALRARLETRGDVDVRYVVLSGADLMGPIAQALDHATPTNIQEFQALVRGTKQRPMVWLIDEADEFARADLAQTVPRPAPLCWALRAVAEEGTAYFVLAGFWGLFRAAVFDNSSPLRNFGELMRLGPLDAAAARELVTQPMQSLGVDVDTAVVDGILEQTGRRANLLVLACQGLVERLRPEQRLVTLEDLGAVWDSYQPLRDALRYWQAEPLDRAVGHAAISLERPTRKAIEERLTAAQIRVTATELDLSLERLELGYVLLRAPEPKGGADRYGCSIPLIPHFESRIMAWDEHLEVDADELRRMA